VPNVGLWDQRAAFEWIHKYIPDIGGDPNKITAMGISAGAGSILHHLTAEGGASDPLFRRAIVQSAGYATTLDRTGEVEQKFRQIEQLTGCKGRMSGLLCLRGLPEEALRTVSDKLGTDFKPGSSGWDPIPDGKYILRTPTLEIAAGMFACFVFVD
jgi:carboxylesterase type B